MSAMSLPPMAAPAPGGAPNPYAAPPPAATGAPGGIQSNLPDWGVRPDWAASSNPDDFSKGGALFGDQANLETIAADFTLDPPPGYTQPNTVFLKLQLRDLSDPTGQTIVPQWWSCGNTGDFLPSADGEWLLPQSEKGRAGINEGTNYGLLVNTLKQKGYPANLLAFGSAKRIFSGPGGNLMFKTIRVVPEGRSNMKPNAKKAGNDDRGPIGTLVCDEILKFPWEAAPRKAIAQRPGQAAPHQHMPPQQHAAPPQQPQYAAPAQQAPPQAPAPQYAAPAPAPAPAAQPLPPQQAAPAPAPSNLISVTDPTQIAALIQQTMASVIDANAGALPVQAARLNVFRALQATHDVNTINQVAGYADNIAWLQSAGFRHDVTANTLHRA